MFAGQYGIPRPWYFPFQKSYWFEVANKRVLEVDAASSDQRPHTAGRGGASYRGWVCEIKMVVIVYCGKQKKKVSKRLRDLYRI